MLTQQVHRKVLSSVYFSTSCLLKSRKKNLSEYEYVNQEKYAALVRSVVSSKVSSQTPETLVQEDCMLYGPVIKSKPPSEAPRPRLPKNPVPLENPAKSTAAAEADEQRPPSQIALCKRQSAPEVPSVTRILQQTMPLEQAFYLERWRRRMIAELGEEGFKAYTATIFSHGKLFHAALESVLLSREHVAKEETAGYLQSIQHILSDVSEIQALESAVQHQVLGYLGLVDCVAKYQGKLCAIDWKTSEKPKPFLRNTFDNPLQVAAYAGAINFDENYNFQVDNGLIVIAYKDGSPAHPHFMDSALCLQYWNKWLLRLEEYKEKIQSKQ
ncbi:mitochondrial genome maintenance exonuclease 1 [Latimeria chalumnae]|nr:PREDICTED: mitochondrial genome maintenance exonuclease 1 [Latimeria chalumnae]XP_005992983.1 PREDICTED: mitochondrial genome maintenance exonuclease 1 [Latimeria chalumnae]|eukprot:XP_005992982.1 PREDICTED: mitochondrial genome maintenance exonuclease 1 [Latimeria chalumnae]